MLQQIIKDLKTKSKFNYEIYETPYQMWSAIVLYLEELENNGQNTT